MGQTAAPSMGAVAALGVVALEEENTYIVMVFPMKGCFASRSRRQPFAARPYDPSLHSP